MSITLGLHLFPWVTSSLKHRYGVTLRPRGIVSRTLSAPQWPSVLGRTLGGQPYPLFGALGHPVIAGSNG
jgi:hypothetical protein